jgi:hypothetical protein
MKERSRLLKNYFPYRSNRVLNNILAFVQIPEDPEPPVEEIQVPKEWVPLTASMFHEWDGTGINAQVIDENPGAELNFNTNVENGGVLAGFSSVKYTLFADVSQYGHLILYGTGGDVRIIANRLTDHGPRKEILMAFNNQDRYWDPELKALVLPLDDIRSVKTTDNVEREDAFTHINAIKVQGNGVTLRGAFFVPAVPTSVNSIRQWPADGEYYNLNGQKITRPVRGGIYILNGKKIIVK